MTFNIPIKEAFPFIRQIISDTFMTDAWYISAPYDDLKKVDRGFRQMLLQKNDIVDMLDRAENMVKEPHLFIIHSALEFYNITALIPCENNPDFISLGPFRDREITDQDFSRIVQTHHFPAKYLDVMRHFYYSLPTADPQNMATAFRHLLSAFLPEFEKISPEYISFSGNQKAEPSPVPNDDHVYSFTADEAEAYCNYLENFISSLLRGKTEEAADKLKLLLDYLGYSSSMPPNQMRKTADFINSFCCSRMLATRIHPVFITNCHTTYEYRIDTAEYQQLLRLPYEICRKYCLMVKNYSLPEYSSLICNIMNYVTVHISEDLNLSAIAAYFHKNPSYISGRFRQETGESLTDFVQKERMQTAIRFFNTTNMSVAEVAGNVGIQDFAYFSRIFKKHIGCSPSQYKKMVNPGHLL